MDPREKYPNIPVHCLPKPKKRDKSTASGLTLWIVETLNDMNNVYAWRQGSEGKFRPGKKVTNVLGQTVSTGDKWLPGDTRGIGDVLCCYNGRHVEFEVKAGRDRQSSRQAVWQKKIEDAGGKYYLVRNELEFWECIKRLDQ